MDEQFFTSEVKEMERTLYRVAYSYLHSNEDAADAVQDALLKGWEKRGSLREEQYFRTWLTRILINVCNVRHRKHHFELPLTEATASSQGDSHHEFYLRDAMADMDIKYRVPLMLFYLDGFSPALNPDLWSPELCRQLAQCAAREATLATWSVAGHVLRALQNAGFLLEKRPGFSGKRQMLVGKRMRDIF